jgi:hypothetical protein
LTFRRVGMDEWLIAYRSYTEAELTEEVTWLRTQVRNPYNAQGEGNRTYARSTAEFRTRLAAATLVQSERTSTEPRHGIADFSGV